jgi:hypothetical protein
VFVGIPAADSPTGPLPRPIGNSRPERRGGRPLPDGTGRGVRVWGGRGPSSWCFRCVHLGHTRHHPCLSLCGDESAYRMHDACWGCCRLLGVK